MCMYERMHAGILTATYIHAAYGLGAFAKPGMMRGRMEWPLHTKIGVTTTTTTTTTYIHTYMPSFNIHTWRRGRALHPHAMEGNTRTLVLLSYESRRPAHMYAQVYFACMYIFVWVPWPVWRWRGASAGATWAWCRRTAGRSRSRAPWRCRTRAARWRTRTAPSERPLRLAAPRMTSPPTTPRGMSQVKLAAIIHTYS